MTRSILLISNKKIEKVINMLSMTQINKLSPIFINIFEFLLKPIPPGNLKFKIRNSFKKIIEYLEFKVQLLLRTAQKEINFENCEGLSEFNFFIPLASEKEGVSVFIRVKDEEAKIYSCLKSIWGLFDEIIIVDNNSSDRTIELINKFKQDCDRHDIIKVFNYPFKMSRFGSEYNQTPEDSVYNFAYFSNYTISKCSYRTLCKWDADMLLRQEHKANLKSFLKQVGSSSYNGVWNIYGQTLYKDSEENFWLSKDEIYYEPRVFSLSYFNIYKKGRFFEVLSAPSLNLDVSFSFEQKNKKRFSLKRKSLSGISFYELKFFAEEEFAHWTPAEVSHTTRKQNEMEAFRSIETGEIYDNDRFTQVADPCLPV